MAAIAVTIGLFVAVGTHGEGLFLRRALGVPVIVQALLSVAAAGLSVFLWLGRTAFLDSNAPFRQSVLQTYARAARATTPVLLTLLAARLLVWRALETLPAGSPVSGSQALGWVLFAAECAGWIAALIVLWRQALSGSQAAASVVSDDSSGAPLEASPALYAVIETPRNLRSCDARDVYRTALACREAGFSRVTLLDTQSRSTIAALAESLGVEYRVLREGLPLFPAIMRTAEGDPLPPNGWTLFLRAGQTPPDVARALTIEWATDETLALGQIPSWRLPPDGRLRNLGLRRQADGALGDPSETPVWLLKNAACARLNVPVETTDALSDALEASGLRTTRLWEVDAPSLRESGGEDWMLRAHDADAALFRRCLSGASLRALWRDGEPAVRRLARLVFLSTPIIALLGGVWPIAAGRWELATFYAPAWLALTLTPQAWPQARSAAAQTLNETQGAIGAWTALAGALCRKAGGSGKPFSPVMKLLRPWMGPAALLAFTLTALGAGARAIFHGEGASGPLWTMMAWATYHALILGAALCASMDRPQRRGATRLGAALPCALQCADRTLAFGEIVNISETGAMIVLPEPAPLRSGCLLMLMTPETASAEPLRARTVRSALDAQNQCRVGVQFEDLSVEDHQVLAGVMARLAAQTTTCGAIEASDAAGRPWVHLLSAPFRRWRLSEKASRRQTPRLRKALSCELTHGQRVWRAVARDVSENGISAYVQNFPPRWSSYVMLETRLTWDDGEVERMPARVTRRGAISGEQQEIGLSFEPLSPEDWRRWIARLYPSPPGRVRTAFDVEVFAPCRYITRRSGIFQRAQVIQASPARLILQLAGDSMPFEDGEGLEVEILNGGPRVSGVAQQTADALAVVAITSADWATLSRLARWIAAAAQTTAPTLGPQEAQALARA